MNDPGEDKRPRDDKGRVQPEYMTRDEMLVEMLTQMRTVADVLDELSEHPMIAAMGKGGKNPMAAMLGG